MLSPMTSQRPDSCQSSAGFRAGRQKFLRADGVHLLAHDLLDFEQGALRQKQIAVNASGKLADVAGAQQKLMAGDLGLGGVFAQRGDEEFAPEHIVGGEFSLTMTSIMNRMVTASLALALLMAGCSASKTEDAAASAKQYQLRGEVMSLDPGGHVATIKHEEIRGFHGRYDDGISVKDPAEFSKLTVGEPITATVYVSGDDMWVGNIQKDSGAAKQ